MKYRIIYGGNFVNKGAEALTLSAVDILREKFPDDEPVLLNLFPNKFGDELNIYDFKVVNMHIRTLFRMHFPILKFILRKSPKSDDEKEIKQLFENAKGFYDINGYGVSAHNQDAIWTLATMFPVFWAQKKDIPVILLPQSLGPFNFKGWKKLFIKPLIRKYLNIPKTVFVRENESVEEVKAIRKSEVYHSNDLVVLNPLKITNSSENSIAVIPNRQLTNFLPFDKVVEIFTNVIKNITDNNYKVYLFAHSTDDFKLCQKIYDNLLDNNNVTHYSDNFSVRETEEILSRMKGVITSRYHGLVHALRAGKPVMTIGWAKKYHSLLKSVGQDEFYSDLSKNHNINEIYTILNSWLEDGLNNSEFIKNRISEIQAQSNLKEYL